MTKRVPDRPVANGLRRGRHRNGATTALQPKDGRGPRLFVRLPVASATLPPAANSLFEEAMAALQRHAYPDAAHAFRHLLADFPDEGALLDRSRVYLDLCQRAMNRGPARPETLEERLTAATAALNNDDAETAWGLAHGVVEASPDQELALYLLAAVEARRGDYNRAIDWLSQAIAASPEIRAQVRLDPDFVGLRDLEAFQILMHVPAAAVSEPSVHRPARARPGANR